ncbi:MAG: FKBP-type peptidyl-prolyl cis-trans isomerase [Brumimicrobium sp.]
MKQIFISITLLTLLIACDVEGVKTDQGDNESKGESNQNDELTDSLVEKLEKDSTNIKTATVEEDTVDILELDNGIKITWYKKGDGKRLKKGDLINIDYRNRVEDGKVYDGNHLIKKPYIPFLVGWNQQTPGWDIALKHLRVGDDVDVFMPAKYARGEKGIEGVVPPNANNILSIRVLSIAEPTKVVDGIRIWRVDQLKNPGDTIRFEDKVVIDYWVSSESTPRYDNSYQRNKPFELVMGDGNIVPGLYKALHFARKGDKLMIHIPAREAYGKKGLVDKVKPNEDIFYDIIVKEVD